MGFSSLSGLGVAVSGAVGIGPNGRLARRPFCEGDKAKLLPAGFDATYLIDGMISSRMNVGSTLVFVGEARVDIKSQIPATWIIVLRAPVSFVADAAFSARAGPVTRSIGGPSSRRGATS